MEYEYDIPNPDSIEGVADFLEFRLAFFGGGMSKAEIRSLLGSTYDSDTEDSFIDSIWLEMERRTVLYGDNPPFEIKDRIIVNKIDWKDMPEYLACLIFSIWGNAYKPTHSGKLFERITNEAVRNFLGGESAIYGHPRGGKLKDIAIRLGEEFVSEPPRRFKDRGVDIILWKPFGDKRPNQIVILIQCAAGDDWKTKTTRLCLFSWAQYMHWAFPPIKGFSIPKIISDMELHEISNECGLLIDRPRIYRNIISGTFDTELRKELKIWCEQRLTNMNS